MRIRKNKKSGTVMAGTFVEIPLPLYRKVEKYVTETDPRSWGSFWILAARAFFDETKIK